jgi:prolyl 4-hydroxylase
MCSLRRLQLLCVSLISLHLQLLPRFLGSCYILGGKGAFPREIQISGASAMASSSSGPGQVPLGTLINEALLAHKNGNFDDAITQYSAALPQVNGKLASTLHSNMGAIYMGARADYEQARFHFNAAVTELPENAQAHYNLAIVLTSKLGEHRKALRHCKAALKLEPENHKAMHLMGNILQSIGMPDEAEKFFVEAEQLATGAGTDTGTSTGTSGDTTASTSTGSSPPLVWTQSAVYNLQAGTRAELRIGDLSYMIKCISDSPKVIVVDDFLSTEEVDHIVSRGKPSLERSYVMGDQASGDGDAPYRSSYNAWVGPDEVLLKIQARLAALTGYPLPYLRQKSEELQVVKYAPGGQFNVHHDSSAFHSRLFTMLMYLNNVEGRYQGGTWFPFAGAAADAVAEGETCSGTSHSNRCPSPLAHASTVKEAIEVSLRSRYDPDGRPLSIDELPGEVVQPRAGSAILFYNYRPDGSIDPMAVHAGLPLRGDDNAPLDCSSTNGCDDVSNGSDSVQKWVANYWVDYDLDLLASLSQS